MRRNHDSTRVDRRSRLGVTVAEGAIVLSILLLIVLSMLDLGLAVLHYNSLSAAARWTAREAIVRGEKAPPERAAWGPSPYSGTAADQSEQSAVVRKCLTVSNPEDVRVRLEWLNGSNQVDERVRVTLDYLYEPLLRLPFFENTYSLTAVSTMTVIH